MHYEPEKVGSPVVLHFSQHRLHVAVQRSNAHGTRDGGALQFLIAAPEVEDITVGNHHKNCKRGFF